MKISDELIGEMATMIGIISMVFGAIHFLVHCAVLMFMGMSTDTKLLLVAFTLVFGGGAWLAYVEVVSPARRKGTGS